MQIYAWSLNKKINSTYQPPLNSGELIEGYLRNSDAFSMFSPKVCFNFESSSAPHWNYMYIPNFGNRYYYIADWIHSEGIWIAALQCDVLASFKTDIGNSDLYVLRSSAEYDPKVIDSKYPVKADIESRIDSIEDVRVYAKGILGGSRAEPNLWEKDFTEGCYVVSVYGPNETGLTHYLCTYSGFKKIAEELYQFDITSGGDWDSLTTEIPEGFAKALANPIQFIASVKWYPSIILSNFSRPVTMKLGYYEITSSPISTDIALLEPDYAIAHFHGTVPLYKHPQQARGTFLNSSPYTSYKLTIPPFGEFDLDSSLTFEASNVDLNWYVDYTSGQGELYMTCGQTYLGKISAMFGIDINLSQDTYNITEAFSKSALLAGAAGALYEGSKTTSEMKTKRVTFSIPKELMLGEIGSRYMKDDFNFHIDLPDGWVKHAASSSVGGFVNFNPGLQPHLTTIGGTASYLAFASGIYPKITATYTLLVDEDNYSFGRPLCKIKKISSIPGYILVEGSRLQLSGATEAEVGQVMQFLTGGFFYE